MPHNNEKPHQTPNIGVASANHSAKTALTAQTDRQVDVNPPAPKPISSSSISQSIDIESITNRVYDKLAQKIKLERDRIGYR
jgi:hypothetical protein